MYYSSFDERISPSQMSNTIYKFTSGYTGKRKQADKNYPANKNYNWFIQTNPHCFYNNSRTPERFDVGNDCGLKRNRAHFKYKQILPEKPGYTYH